MAGQEQGVVSLPPLPVTCSVDDALGGKVQIAQPETGFRFGSDAVLLASAFSTQDGARVLDLGTGTGVVGLCMAYRLPTIHVTAVEMDPNMAAIARHNVALNHLQDRMRIVSGTIGKEDLGLADNAFDAVVFNPPYFHPSRAQSAAGDQRSLARQGDGQELGIWFKAARRYLKPGGHVAVILRAEALADILEHMAKGFGAVRMIPLWPKAGRAAKNMIVSAVKGSRAPLTVEAGITLHTENGGQTAAATHILWHGGTLEEAQALSLHTTTTDGIEKN